MGAVSSFVDNTVGSVKDAVNNPAAAAQQVYAATNPSQSMKAMLSNNGGVQSAMTGGSGFAPTNLVNNTMQYLNPVTGGANAIATLAGGQPAGGNLVGSVNNASTSLGGQPILPTSGLGGSGGVGSGYFADLTGAARETAAGNLANAQAATQANRTNTTGPTGTSNWTKDANGNWTQTNSLSAPLQGIANSAQTNLANAQQNPLSVGSLQYGYNNAGDITGSTNNNSNSISANLSGNTGKLSTSAGDPNLINQQVTDALYKQQTKYLDPQFQQQQSDLDNKLANQGITRGSEAWNREMLNAGNQKQQAYDNARNSAIGQGVSAAQGMFGMNLNNANLNNSAFGQQFNQNANAQNYNNQALGQQFNQNLAANQFANQAQNQKYTQGIGNAGLNNAAYAQALQGNIGIQNQYQNQLAGLYGLTPQGPQYNQSATAGPDLLGAAQANNANTLAQNNAAIASGNTTTQGLFGLGAAALAKYSDPRTKENIVCLGVDNGFNIYEFDYKAPFKALAGFGRYIGVMADEVKKVCPDAVTTDHNGVMKVNYSMLGLEMVEVK